MNEIKCLEGNWIDENLYKTTNYTIRCRCLLFK